MVKVELHLLCVAAVPKPKGRMRVPSASQNPVNFSWYLLSALRNLEVLPAGLTTPIQLPGKKWKHMAGVKMGTGLALSATVSILITLSIVSHCTLNVKTRDTAEPGGLLRTS